MEGIEISLREAAAEDVETIARVHAESWRATYRGLLPDAYLDYDAEKERAAYWAAHIRVPPEAGRLLLVAECNGVAAGFVCAELKPGSPDGALLDNLHVAKPYQGFGIGKRMMDAVEQWARELGETRLHLFVLEGNHRAMTFYERQGWRLIGIEPDEMAGIPVTARRYGRPIPPPAGKSTE